MLFRYANLTDLGFLSTPGFIAGVTNPMFKSKREWWDVLCDISTGEVILSAPAERDEYEGTDRMFVLEVLDGLNAGYDEEWIRCMFEEYTRKNVVDIALGEANYIDVDTQVKRIAMNNKRITRWARTDNYKLLTDSRKHRKFSTPAFNISTQPIIIAGVLELFAAASWRSAHDRARDFPPVDQREVQHGDLAQAARELPIDGGEPAAAERVSTDELPANSQHRAAGSERIEDKPVVWRRLRCVVTAGLLR
ncbi:Mesa protein, partial [Globisporangium splendens]